MLLSKEQVEEIVDVIRRRHNIFVAKTIGPELLSTQELTELKKEYGEDAVRQIEDFVKDGYYVGYMRNKDLGSVTDVSHDEFVHEAKPSLNSLEEYSIEHSKEVVEAYVQKLSQGAQTNMEALIREYNKRYKDYLMTNVGLPMAVLADERNQSVGDLLIAMRDLTGDMARDWERVARTETTNVINTGMTDKIIKMNPGTKAEEIYVFKRVVNDAALCLKEDSVIEVREENERKSKFIPINQARIGQKVKTHQREMMYNKFDYIDDIEITEYEGQLITFELQTNEKLSVTPEHPILVKWQNKFYMIEAKYITKEHEIVKYEEIGMNKISKVVKTFEKWWMYKDYIFEAIKNYSLPEISKEVGIGSELLSFLFRVRGIKVQFKQKKKWRRIEQLLPEIKKDYYKNNFTTEMLWEKYRIAHEILQQYLDLRKASDTGRLRGTLIRTEEQKKNLSIKTRERFSKYTDEQWRRVRENNKRARLIFEQNMTEEQREERRKRFREISIKNWQNLEFRDKVTERMLNGGAEYAKKHNCNPSKPQKQFYELVTEIYPQAILNKALRLKRHKVCFIDIAIPDKKIAIEYDGSYWHDEEKDNERDLLIVHKDWKILRYIDWIPTKEILVNHIEEIIGGKDKKYIYRAVQG